MRRVQLEEAEQLDGQLKHWAYNAADCVGTHEIGRVLEAKLEQRPRCARTYRAEMAYQTPAMQMMLRGIRVDTKARAGILGELRTDVEKALAEAAELVADVWDGREKETGLCSKSKRKDGRHTWAKAEREEDRSCTECGAPRFSVSPFNANSSAQALHLFRDLLRVKPGDLRNKKGGQSADDEVLDRIKRKWPRHAAVVEAIQTVRDLKKQIGDVKAPLDDRGRYCFSINVGATVFGRTSSSKNAMGLGGNIQNKAERHRRMFIADPGYELAYCDLKQAESLCVAYLAEDEAYIEAHQTGDTHTYVARILFPELPWAGDIARDKAIAKETFFDWDSVEGHDARFQAKRMTHGKAYGISPVGVARNAHIPQVEAKTAHGRLDAAFPNIEGVYWPNVRERVRNQLPIVTAVGREIQLFGRPWDDATFRQGLSAEPQSIVGDLPQLAAVKLWHEHDRPDGDPEVQLLANCHDALLVQWRVEDRERAARAVKEAMEIPLSMPGGRTMTIPVEVAVGQNWGHASPDNPEGLKEYEL